MKLLKEIAEYKFLEDGTDIYIEAKSGNMFKFSEQPLGKMSVYPITKESLEAAKNTTVLESYPFKDNYVYYFVEYGGAVFILKQLEDAVAFSMTVLKIQTLIYEQTFKG